MISLTKRRDMDMTQGTIWKLLLEFSLPLMIGNVFQQLYTTVDSMVVGNFVGSQALAAVGSTGCIINTLIGFFSGIATGAGVIISQHFGAKDAFHLHQAVQMSVLLTLIMSVVGTAVGVAMTPAMLRWMSTPDDVYGEAVVYLRIYFAGAAGLMVYNMGAGILRAVGDSRRPLYFLIFSAVTNTALDLLFVVVFHWGIAGVAYATILSEFLSAVLVLFVLTRSREVYRIIWRDHGISREMLLRIIRIGLPFGLQMAITSFSNVFVQAYINDFGSACMAGWSSYSKIDQFAILPMQSISMACSTFVGQNIGAKNYIRAKRGTNIALLLSVAITVLLMIPTMLLAGNLVALFNQDPDVIYYGRLFILLESPFYFLCCVNQIYGGSLRGAGNTKAPMMIMLGSFVVFRQCYLFLLSRYVHSIVWIALGYPAGWIVCSTWIYIYYQRHFIKNFSVEQG